MKTRDQDIVDILRCDAMTPALMLKMTRPIDSLAVGFTSSSNTITYDSVDYTPDQSLAQTAFAQKVDFSTDNVDLKMLTSDLVTEDDLRAGMWTDSVIVFFLLPDRADLTKTIPLNTYLGHASRVEDGHAWRLNLRGYGERLAMPSVDITSIMCRRRLGDAICRVDTDPDDWAASTAYTAVQEGDRSVGSYVKPTTYTGLHAKCTTAGTSDSSEPTWPPNAGQTVDDNGTIWEMYDALTKEAAVTQVYDRLRFEASSLTDADDTFRYGKITWVTGDNAGFVEDIRHFVDGGAFTLVDEMANDIAIGDTFEAQVGCRFRIVEDCVGQFDNVDNYGAEWALPGGDEQGQFPNAR